LAAVADGLGSGIVVFWGEQEKEVKKTLGKNLLTIKNSGDASKLRR
jgi:hypothetical protein